MELLANVPPSPNEPPSVGHRRSPVDAVFFRAGEIPIRAEAADHDGVVKKVEFYVGDRLLGSDDLAPFTLPWSNVSRRRYIS